ncbi:exodeoxyribonuclease III [Cupriavidus basilensis]
MQELKAQAADMTEAFLAPHGYHGFFHYAEKKGYSGVGLYTRHKPRARDHGLRQPRVRQRRPLRRSAVSAPCRDFGLRAVRLEFGGAPAGKVPFHGGFPATLAATEGQRTRDRAVRRRQHRAHKEIDIKNWKGNLKNSGFLPEERAWIGELFDTHGYVDVFRQLDQRPEQYTWWSNRGQAYAKNVGWRIDYHLATPKIAITAHVCSIYKDEKFSDHAPLSIDYDFPL